MKNLKKLSRESLKLIKGGLACVWDTGYCPPGSYCCAPAGTTDYSGYLCRREC